MFMTKSTKKNVVFCLYQVKINETTLPYITLQPVHYQTLEWQKNGVMARHAHLSHIYFYFTPFILRTLVGAMLYSSIPVSLVLLTWNKSTTL